MFSTHFYGHINLPSRHLGLIFSSGLQVFVSWRHHLSSRLHYLHVFKIKMAIRETKLSEEISDLLLCFSTIHDFQMQIEWKI